MAPLFFTSNNAVIGFFVVYIGFFVVEQIGGVIVPWIRRGGAKVRRGNRGSNAIVIVSWVASLAFSVVVAKNSLTPLPDWLYYFGIVVMCVGIVFRQWAIAVLGRYFSGVIGVQKEQKVVDSGPYRLIRHPSYTGVLIYFVGMGLALQSWEALLVNTAIFAIAYGYRIYVEERVLKRELGSSYTDYMKRTKRVIPYLV